MSEYLRNCIETDYIHWKLAEKIGASSEYFGVPISRHLENYHEPALVYRSFSIYKFDPKTREDDRNYVIQGFVDAYGKIIINYHYRTGAMIV